MYDVNKFQALGEERQNEAKYYTTKPFHPFSIFFFSALPLLSPVLPSSSPPVRCSLSFKPLPETWHWLDSVLTSPHSLCPIKEWLTDPSVSSHDQSKEPVSSQQEDVSILLLFWQEVSLLKVLLGNVFLFPIFSYFPPLTNGDKLVINIAATLLPNGVFFVNSHVSERSSTECHSSRPCSPIPYLDPSVVQPLTAGVCQPCVCSFMLSHFSLSCRQKPQSSWNNQDWPAYGKISRTVQQTGDKWASVLSVWKMLVQHCLSIWHFQKTKQTLTVIVIFFTSHGCLT